MTSFLKKAKERFEKKFETGEWSFVGTIEDIRNDRMGEAINLLWDFIEALLKECDEMWEHTLKGEVEDARKEERQLVRKEIWKKIPKWIDNPLGEVNSYTEGRRDEREENRKLIEEVLNSKK